MRQEDFVRLVGEELESRSVRFEGSFVFDLRACDIIEEPKIRYDEGYVDIDVKVRKKSDFLESVKFIFDSPKKCGVVSSSITFKDSRLCNYPVLISSSYTKDPDYVVLSFKGLRVDKFKSLSEESFREFTESSSTYSYWDSLELENEDRIRAGFERK